jgi:hypothetical protein
MTAKQFLKLHPDAESNADGLLEDMACRNCGNRETFRIAFSGIAEVDNESSSDDGDHEWDDRSHCHCPQCGTAGKVKAFQIKGLDDLIAENSNPIPA